LNQEQMGEFSRKVVQYSRFNRFISSMGGRMEGWMEGMSAKSRHILQKVENVAHHLRTR
jgi:hypothetical protein